MKPRNTADWDSEPIDEALALELHAELVAKYGSANVRYAVLCKPVHVEKVIDNAADARETIRRLFAANPVERLAAPSPGTGEPKQCGPGCGTVTGRFRFRTPQYCSEACCDAGHPLNPRAPAVPAAEPGKPATCESCGGDGIGEQSEHPTQEDEDCPACSGTGALPQGREGGLERLR